VTLGAGEEPRATRPLDERRRRFTHRLRHRFSRSLRRSSTTCSAGERAKAALDELKDWLRLHNAAGMAVLFPGVAL